MGPSRVRTSLKLSGFEPASLMSSGLSQDSDKTVLGSSGLALRIIRNYLTYVIGLIKKHFRKITDLAEVLKSLQA